MLKSLNKGDSRAIEHFTHSYWWEKGYIPRATQEIYDLDDLDFVCKRRLVFLQLKKLRVSKDVSCNSRHNVLNFIKDHRL